MRCILEILSEGTINDLSLEEDGGASDCIHMGAMGGTLGVMQYHNFGIEVQESALMINPDLPEE